MKTQIKLFYFLGAPVYLHISMLLVLLYFITNRPFEAAVIATLAFVVVMLIHEMGHAFFVKHYRHQLNSIGLYPIHGVCFYEHDADWEVETLVIAGGIIAQFLLLIAWLAVIVVLEFLHLYQFERNLEPVTDIFIQYNIISMVINLLPVKGLDGYDLWLRFIDLLKIKWSKLTPKKTKKPSQQSAQKVVDMAIKRAQKKSK